MRVDTNLTIYAGERIGMWTAYAVGSDHISRVSFGVVNKSTGVVMHYVLRAIHGQAVSNFWTGHGAEFVTERQSINGTPVALEKFSPGFSWTNAVSGASGSAMSAIGNHSSWLHVDMYGHTTSTWLAKVPTPIPSVSTFQDNWLNCW